MTTRDDIENPSKCSLARALEIVGERWMFFILREAMSGSSRFSEFRSTLGIASDVLTARLTKLVDAGLMTRQSYREAGQRARYAYHLTEPGWKLSLVIHSLQQWGDEYVPSSLPMLAFRTATGDAASVAFVDGQGRVVPQEEVRAERRDAATRP